MAAEQIALWGWHTATGTWVKLAVTDAGLLRIDLTAISLGDLGDVNPAAPADNDSLTWDAATGLWIPEARLISVGGLYGINVEVLGAAKTLTPGTDKIYQYLDPGAFNRIITLDTASATAGDRFVIRNTGAVNFSVYLHIKQAAATLDYIYTGDVKQFIFDGTNWIGLGIGTGDNTDLDYNLGIGYKARAYNAGVALGREARGYTYGVAVGYGSLGYDDGVAVGQNARGYGDGTAVGRNAYGHNYGVAVGRNANTNNKVYSIAFGYRSECERTAETSINIDANSSQKNNIVQGRWAGTTTDDTPAEIFCGGVADQRFTIRAISALAFKMTIVARDNVGNEVAMYTVEDGLIKRDGANNTVMVNCTVTTVHEDDATWAVAVTADDTNEALIITVTGDADNPVQWAVRMDGVETHF